MAPANQACGCPRTTPALLPAHKADFFNAGFYYPTLTDDDNSMWGISSRRNDTAVFQSLPWALEDLLGFGPATQVGPLAQLLLWTKRVLGASTVAWKWTFDYGQPSLTVYSDSSETATTSVFRWPTTSAAVNTLRRLPKTAHGDVTEVLTCLWAATSKTRG